MIFEQKNSLQILYVIIKVYLPKLCNFVCDYWAEKFITNLVCDYKGLFTKI